MAQTMPSAGPPPPPIPNGGTRIKVKPPTKTIHLEKDDGINDEKKETSLLIENDELLEKERLSHNETKLALVDARRTNSDLEEQIFLLKAELRSQEENLNRKVNELQQDLDDAEIRVQAAEEDAQLALDLAKENAENREKYEELYNKSVEEVNSLQQQLERATSIDETKRKLVRFAASSGDDNKKSDVTEQQNEVGPPKLMVATGRALLKSSRVVTMTDEDCIDDDDGITSNIVNLDNDDLVHIITIEAKKSLERRRELRERIQNLHNDKTMPKFLASFEASNSNPTTSSTTNEQQQQSSSPEKAYRHGVSIGFATKSMETLQSVSKVLRESGKRLHLAGHWWAGSNSNKKAVGLDDVNVEAMARHYCQAVEVKIDRQNDDAKELEALCDFLERKLISVDETDTDFIVEREQKDDLLNESIITDTETNPAQTSTDLDDQTNVLSNRAQVVDEQEADMKPKEVSLAIDGNDKDEQRTEESTEKQNTEMSLDPDENGGEGWDDW